MPPFDETSESYDGTVCLSKATFLDGFLLPRLARFNSDSTWVVDEAWWKSENAGFSTKYNVYGHLGLTAKDLEDDQNTREVTGRMTMMGCGVFIRKVR